MNAPSLAVSPSGYAKKRVRDKNGDVSVVDDKSKPYYNINGQQVAGLRDAKGATNYAKAVGGPTEARTTVSASMTNRAGQPNQGKKIDARPQTNMAQHEAAKQAEFNDTFHGAKAAAPAATGGSTMEQGAAKFRQQLEAQREQDAMGGAANQEMLQTGRAPMQDGVVQTTEGRLAFKGGRQVGSSNYGASMDRRRRGK